MVTEQILDASNMMCNVDPKDAKYYTLAAIVRGETVSSGEVAHYMDKLRKDNKNYFLKWFPDNLKSAICRVPSCVLPTSAVSVGFNTTIKEMFRRI